MTEVQYQRIVKNQELLEQYEIEITNILKIIEQE